MLKFHSIKVARVYPETPFATGVVFEIPEELAEQYQFLQGQHVNCKLKVGDKEIRRSYSLCNAPGENLWRITVKYVDGGAFSTFVRDQLRAGDMLEIMTPAGRFRTEISEDNSKNYVAFAAGSGITPVISNLRAILLGEPKSQFTLFYANRNLKSVLLREELQDLKNKYMDRFSVHYLFSQEHREIDLYTGRLDANKAEALLNNFYPDLSEVDDFFVCGPGTMIKDLTERLIELGVPSTDIHSERFGVPKKKLSTKVSESIVDHHTAEVTVIMDGHQRMFKVYDDDNLIDAAAKEGLELPYSCKAGVCSTCRTKLVSGEVEMAVNHALEPWELEQSYILACQSCPRTDTLSIDYDS